MKFGIAKLPQSFYKDTEKNFKRKKSNKELSLIDDRKVNANLCHDRKNFFSLFKLSAVAFGGATGNLGPPFWFIKIFFWNIMFQENRQ